MTQASLHLPQTPAELRAIGTRNPMTAARQAVEGFGPGGRVVGLTKGSFSLLDLIRAILELTGPARLAVSVWTIGPQDIAAAAMLLDREILTGLSLLLDRSFPTRHPRYCAALLDRFGADAVRLTRTHTKIATITADGWDVAVSASMNLNRNIRCEQFNVDESPRIARFYRDHMAEMSAGVPAGLEVTEEEIRAVFDRAWRGLGPLEFETSAPSGTPIDGTAAEFAAWVRARLRECRRARRSPASIRSAAGRIGMTPSDLRAWLRTPPAMWRQAAVDLANLLSG